MEDRGQTDRIITPTRAGLRQCRWPLGSEPDPPSTAVFSSLAAIITITGICLQCFDAVGWAAGMASGL